MVKCMQKGLDMTMYIKTHLDSSASIFYLIQLDIEVPVYSLHGSKVNVNVFLFCYVVIKLSYGCHSN